MTNKKHYSVYELRMARNLTQKQVANDLGVSLTTYRQWEKDLSDVSISKVVALANYYDVRVGQFLLCPST
jgi:transcriptional regulator with XRE-family HTH domain